MASPRCPVCAAKLPNDPCDLCGTRQIDGAIPCNASTEIPHGCLTTPCSTDSASFADARLSIRGDVARIRSTINTFVFGIIFVAIAGGCFYWAYSLFRQIDFSLSFETIFALAGLIPLWAGLLFGFVGVAIVLFHHKVKIDREQMTIRWASGFPANDGSLSHSDSLQILRKSASSKNGSYSCYELNLFTNGDRINLLSHGDSKRLRRDAHALSQFLNIKLLDQTDERVITSQNGAGLQLSTNPALKSA